MILAGFYRLHQSQFCKNLDLQHFLFESKLIKDFFSCYIKKVHLFNYFV